MNLNNSNSSARPTDPTLVVTRSGSVSDHRSRLTIRDIESKTPLSPPNGRCSRVIPILTIGEETYPVTAVI